MSDVHVKELVYSFCQALTIRNLDKINGLFTQDSCLSWGPYVFEGREKIVGWASELFELFPFMSIKEKTLKVDGASAKHEFLIAFLTTQGRKGWIPCEADYSFKGDKINGLKVRLLHGFLAISKEEVEKVRPHEISK